MRPILWLRILMALRRNQKALLRESLAAHVFDPNGDRCHHYLDLLAERSRSLASALIYAEGRDWSLARNILSDSRRNAMGKILGNLRISKDFADMFGDRKLCDCLPRYESIYAEHVEGLARQLGHPVVLPKGAT